MFYQDDIEGFKYFSTPCHPYYKMLLVLLAKQLSWHKFWRSFFAQQTFGVLHTRWDYPYSIFAPEDFSLPLFHSSSDFTRDPHVWSRLHFLIHRSSGTYKLRMRHILNIVKRQHGNCLETKLLSKKALMFSPSIKHFLIRQKTPYKNKTVHNMNKWTFSCTL